jgi:hypothetical protein
MKLAATLAIVAYTITTTVHAETRVVGPGGQPNSLRAALEAADDGDVIELLPGEYRGDSAVVPAKRLTIRGMGQRPVLRGNSNVAEGRSILVIRGGDVTVENLEFRGARAPDANGAGIRQEGGHLKVVRCGFYDNENGILTGNDEKAELEIDSSVFGDAPRVVGGLYHLLYVGRIGRFSVTGSRFHTGFEGQLLKSRARESRIGYNLIVDGPGGEASYEIELPNGGLVWIIGNVISQAASTQNPVVIAYGADRRPWERNALTLAHNTIINDRLIPAWFLRVWRDRLPETTQVVAVNNLTIGPGLFAWGAAGEFEGNQYTWGQPLVDPSALAFELKAGSPLRGTGIDPRNVGGQDLSPKFEFTLPVGTRALTPPQRWSPGAFQR